MLGDKRRLARAVRIAEEAAAGYLALPGLRKQSPGRVAGAGHCAEEDTGYLASPRDSGQGQGGGEAGEVGGGEGVCVAGEAAGSMVPQGWRLQGPVGGGAEVGGG